MPQSFWESETVEQEKQQIQEDAASPATLALSVDEFAALEERVLRAVELVKKERQARNAVEERIAQLETQLLEQMELADRQQKEMDTLRTEREEVRQRVERLLSQLDTLEV